MKPFIDNQRGATMRYKSHKEATHKPFWQFRAFWLAVTCACIAISLTYGR